MLRFLPLFIFVLICCTGCTLRSPSTEKPISGSVSGESSGKYSTGVTEDEKIKLARSRQKEIRTLRKGDYLFVKNNPEKAILYYQAVLEKLPDDFVVRRKIAHTYFEMQDWKNAYIHYAQVPLTELKGDEPQELFNALFYDTDRIDRLGELVRYTLDANLLEYYQTLDICYSGIHNCIVSLESYTGANMQVQEIKNIISSAEKISPDFQYRNFLVATEFYRQRAYRVAEILAAEILTKRPNYTEVKKLRGFALAELGRFNESRDILLAYLESVPKDGDSIRKLGEIYALLGDYTTSNLYLNNVVITGTKNKSEIERQLAYNYAALDDHPSMLKVLAYLLQESDVNEDDFAVAISLALREGENIRAYSWADTGIQKYPQSAILAPLYIQSLRLNGKANEVKNFINGLSSEITKLPLVQLEYANTLLEEGNIAESTPIFTALVELDPNSEWGIEASTALKNMNSIITNSGTSQP